jgi:hypothetical protein
MNREDIILMARKAGLVIEDKINGGTIVSHVGIERFAILVADAEAKRIYEEGMVTVGHMREQILAEREACAKVCENEWSTLAERKYGDECADAIRARGQA